MSRFGLGLEGQEQELEIDMAIDVEDKRNALAGDSMADTPFSPMVSRAFTTAVDDSETLAEMNDVLENNDIEGIPESSRQVIQTAMESVRSRLLGGYSVRGVAVEGFASNKDLKIAIEDNKNILQRAWDAIVKFFKGIYDWFAGFFKKKKTDAEIFQKRLDKGMDILSEMLSKNFEEIEITEIPPLHGVGVKLSDGTVVGKNNVASEDGEVDYNKLIPIVKGILTGRESVVLISNRYNAIFGSSNVKAKAEFAETLKKISDKAEIALNGVEKTGLEGFAEKPITKETIAGITEKTMEELFGGSIPITMGTSIEISGNSVSVKKPESNEIEIAMYGGPSSAKSINTILKDQLKEVIVLNKECFEFTASMANKVHDFNKQIGTDTEESEESIKLMRSKMQMVNGMIKFIALLMNQTMNIVRLSVDLLDSYVAAVAMIVNQAKKAQAK
jgi:hypothetical protein